MLQTLIVSTFYIRSFLHRLQGTECEWFDVEIFVSLASGFGAWLVQKVNFDFDQLSKMKFYGTSISNSFTHWTVWGFQTTFQKIIKMFFPSNSINWFLYVFKFAKKSLFGIVKRIGEPIKKRVFGSTYAVKMIIFIWIDSFTVVNCQEIHLQLILAVA